MFSVRFLQISSVSVKISYTLPNMNPERKCRAKTIQKRTNQWEANCFFMTPGSKINLWQDKISRKLNKWHRNRTTRKTVKKKRWNYQLSGSFPRFHPIFFIRLRFFLNLLKSQLIDFLDFSDSFVIFLIRFKTIVFCLNIYSFSSQFNQFFCFETLNDFFRFSF